MTTEKVITDIRQENQRSDFDLIVSAIPEGASVIDVGCGDGILLDMLVRNRTVRARGIELSMEGVAKAVAKGLCVIQGDADRDLADLPDGCFDYAVLSQTLQATKEPKTVLEQLMRISDRVIVSFPNFGHWMVRLNLLLSGRMPKTRALSIEWYDTHNIHLCTIVDFMELCANLNATVERAWYLYKGQPIAFRGLANLLSDQAIFILRRR